MSQLQPTTLPAAVLHIHSLSLRCGGLMVCPVRGFISMMRRCRTVRPFSASSCQTGSTHGVGAKPHVSYSLRQDGRRAAAASTCIL
jgi:hypothetical protein